MGLFDMGSIQQRVQLAKEAFNNQDHPNAFNRLYPLASTGDPEIMYMLGMCYVDGLGTNINYGLAIDYLMRSANMNYPPALRQMGYMNRRGLGMQINHMAARDWFSRALQAQDIDARYEIMLENEFMGNDNINSLNHNEIANVGDNASHENLYEFAIKYYLACAKYNNEIAMNLLGNLYSEGEGVQQDYAKAREWYIKAFQNGNGNACYNLGTIYELGKGVLVDYARALDYYQKALELGIDTQDNINNVKRAMNGTLNVYAPLNYNTANLEEVCVNAINADQFVLAFNCAVELANRGYVEAFCPLGNMYYYGKGTQVNHDQARFWLEKSIQNNCEGYWMLGRMYDFGNGVPKNRAKAMELYQKGINAGEYECLKSYLNASFWYNLEKSQGIVFAVVNDEGVRVPANQATGQNNSEQLLNEGRTAWSKKDFATAFAKYKAAAELGNIEAINLLGNCYNDGKGTEQNYVKGFECKKRAAEQNEKFACFGMGQHYRLGQGVTKNLAEAKKWYEKADSLKHMSAKKYLRLMAEMEKPYEVLQLSAEDSLELAKTFEEEQRHEFALKYYLRAANLGNVEAMNLVGNHFYEGTGTSQNDERALCWYTQAAEAGNKYALFNLGKLYEFGRGVPMNYSIALDYYTKAKSAGNNVEDYIQNINNCMNGVDMYLNYGEMSEQELVDRYNRYNGKHQSQLLAKCAVALSDLGNTSVKNNLGNIYLEGKGIERNYYAAHAFYEQACNVNDKYGFFNLGKMYEYGIGVEQDLDRAVELYRRAMELGHSEGSKYFENAVYWRDLAANQNLYFGLLGDEAVVLQRTGTVTTEGPRLDFQTEDDFDYEEPEETEPVQNVGRPTELSGERPNELPENLDAYFDGIIGMSSVKNQLNKIYNSVKLRLKRDEILRSRGETPAASEQAYNFILLGNPGTGKTMVARIIAKILYDINIREKNILIEADRSKLVGEYIGGTEKKVRQVMSEATGGTLFIDEAHSLYRENSDNDFGQEAIDTLIKEMEDRRDEFSVIIAGYREPMLNMIKNANSGFQSRFTYTIELPDYTDDELIEIAHTLMDKQKYVPGDKVDIAIKKNIEHDKIDDTFGNARYIRELVKRAIENQATRLQDMDAYSEEDLFKLEASDFWQGELEEKGVQDYLDELNSLTGLQSVKEEVKTLINRIQVQTELEKRGLASSQDFGTLHMAFKGNPGTGKTTVARLLGDLYSALGILKRKNVFVECSRASLVGQYQGHTAVNVKKAVQSALGGILFVDEAYSLVQGEGDSFGKEAVDTLVAEMENHRKHLVVIFAGYSNDLDEFFKNNQGLRSRVPIELYFEDYSQPELYSIALGMIKAKGFTLADEAETKLKTLILAKSMMPDFGNARGVRNLVDGFIRKQNVRMATLLTSSPEQVTNDMLITISIEDIE